METINQELLYAARNGNFEMVKELLKGGANINYQDKTGYTALILAAWQHRIEIVRFLLKNGANVNLTTKEGETALIKIAGNPIIFPKCADKSLEIVQLLLTNGADANSTSKYGKTPLSSSRFSSNEVFELIAYAIYEQELIARYKQNIPPQLQILAIEDNSKIKSLQQLCNEVQKTKTNIDFQHKYPKLKLEENLMKRGIKINDNIITKIIKTITYELANESNTQDLQNQPSRSGYKPPSI